MPTMIHDRPAASAATANALEKMRQVFGFAQFREGQAEVISRLLDGRSVLAVFPTGGGKSLCYQLPALMLDGLTVVVSPLIALMKDQIDFLLEHGVPAARLDSSLTARKPSARTMTCAPGEHASCTSRPSGSATSGSCSC